MLVDPERRALRDRLDRPLEAVIREGLDPAAVAADEMVMVVAARLGRLVPGAARPQVDPVDEAERGQRLERPVDTCDADAGAPRADPVVNL